MLDDWWRTRLEEYKALSARAADHFATRSEPEWQIESAYHRLIADPDAGADAVWNLSVEWNNTFQYALIEALVRAGMEHAEAGRVEGRAKGWILYRKGRLERQTYTNAQALETLQQAIQCAGDDRQLRANVLQAQGDVLYFLDRRDEALSKYEAALSLFKAVGDRLGEANVLQSRADVLDLQGQTEQALSDYEHALQLYREIDEYSVARALYYLGRLYLRHDETAQARAALEQAIVILDARGLPDIAAIVRRALDDLSK
jgi:tetratricopeptide (TPR) repeat protein